MLSDALPYHHAFTYFIMPRNPCLYDLGLEPGPTPMLYYAHFTGAAALLHSEPF
jgi:hypothetical protein